MQKYLSDYKGMKLIIIKGRINKLWSREKLENTAT
jgi:hypothetical protein